jgi:hypothetical protein
MGPEGVTEDYSNLDKDVGGAAISRHTPMMQEWMSLARSRSTGITI